MKKYIKIFLCFFIVVIPHAAFADHVKIRSVTVGYPAPGAGHASLNAEIFRPTNQYFKKQNEEKFFKEIEEVLGKYKDLKDWGALFPDGPFISIEIKINGKEITLASAHPFFEKDPNSVVTQHGSEQLKGRSRQEVFLEQPDDFKQGKKAFDEVLKLVRNFVGAQMLGGE